MHVSLLLLALLAPRPEDPPRLELDVTATAVVTAEDERAGTMAMLFTPLLDPEIPVRSFALAVEEPGVYRLECRSPEADVYLILRRDGKVVAEDDDGWMRGHARITCELEAGVEYVVQAGGVQGRTGELELTLHRGAPEPISPRERLRAELEDAERCVAYLEQRDGPESEPLAFALEGLGTAYYGIGDYDRAFGSYERALGIREIVHEPVSEETARVLDALSAIAATLGDSRAAVDYAERCVEMIQEIHGERHVLVARALETLAAAYWEAGDPEQARPVVERALEIAVDQFGPLSLEAFESRSTLAVVIDELGFYAEALVQYETLLETVATRPELGDLDRAFVLSSMNEALKLLGRRDEAVAATREALAIHEVHLGEGHPETTTVRANLGVLLTEEGRHAEARTVLERTVAERERQYGAENPITAKARLRVAQLLEINGNCEEALPLFEQVLAVYRNTIGDEHPDTGHCLASYALTLSRLGREEEALDSARAALRIAETARGPMHRTVAYRANILAGLLTDLGRRTEALPFRRRALEVSVHNFGPVHPDVAVQSHNLGLLLDDLGRHEEALDHLLRGEEVSRATHLDARQRIDLLATTIPGLRRAGRDDAAWELAREALVLFSENLARFELGLAEWERLQVAARYRTLIEQAVDLSRMRTGDEAGRVYESVLLWKGWSSRSLLRTRRSVVEHLDERGRAVMADLQRTEAQLGAAALRGLEPERLEELRERRGALERELVTRSQAGAGSAPECLTREDLQAALPPRSALIDFLIATRTEVRDGVPRSAERLNAWILHPTGGERLLLDLGPATPIARAATDLLLDLAARNARGPRGIGAEIEQADEGTAGPDLRELLWDRLEAELADVDLVFICPDGFLSSVPFEVIPAREGGYLVEGRSFVYVQDAASLVEVIEHPSERASAARTVLVTGDVDYDARSEEASPDASVGTARPTTASATRAAQWERWEGLRHTGPEADVVAALAREELGDEVDVVQLAGGSATETALKRNVAGHRFVHLATHGFYRADDAELERLEGTGGEQSRVLALMPGLRTGLVCAGANLPPTVEDDGLLTAEEVTWLDLSACDLVVLSACQTGLGQHARGQGSSSLQRSFLVAGARTVVSSLWSVDDATTAELMRSFYRRLWVEGATRAEALRGAQLELLEASRATFGHGRPELWGAFVLTGDWR